MTKLYDQISLLSYDKLPHCSLWQICHSVLYYLNSMSLFNVRSFKYFDFFLDQILTKTTVVDFYYISKFKQLIAMIRRNILAYIKLQNREKIVIEYIAC